MNEDKIKYLLLAITENDDQAAFRDLLHMFSEGLYAYTFSIVNNAPAAEEIVEDVFVNLWKNRKMLPAIKNISYYLYTACKNNSLNYLQKNKKYFSFSLDNLDGNTLFSYKNPETEFIEKSNLQMILNAIKQLPPACQMVFRLAKEDGLSYQAIAELLNISPKTVENHMNKAIKLIANSLRDTLPEFSEYYKRRAK